MNFATKRPVSLKEAKQFAAEVHQATEQVIKVMTAEQALKAQRAVRQAGRK